MTEKARRGTKRVVVEMELVKEEYNERDETGAFSELRTCRALPRQGMPMYVEVRWGGGSSLYRMTQARTRTRLRRTWPLVAEAHRDETIAKQQRPRRDSEARVFDHLHHLLRPLCAQPM